MREVTVNLQATANDPQEQHRILSDSIGSNTIIGCATCSVAVLGDGTVSVVVNGVSALLVQAPQLTRVETYHLSKPSS